MKVNFQAKRGPNIFMHLQLARTVGEQFEA